MRELPSLRTLEVLGAQRDQPAVDALSQLTGIRRLTLWDLPIPDTDLQQLRQALSACRIDGEPNMTPLDNWLLDAELMQREF